ALAMLARKFNRALRKIDKRTRPNVQDMKFDNKPKFSNSQRKTKEEERSGQNKGVQCHECEGYGHIRSECATYLKKQKKGMM
ncbi:hypothetical protein, partial [Bacillus cereus]|uniref:hypothetical protein n=1 Tax=Bacillus cereus TaxID=1396 RepID=UPI0034D70C4E